ncbi:MAG: hypothetical protein K2K91_06840 [Ruminococcus sp.]|nr:hypothetical protein [Ruminococcus sp.]
MRKIKNILVLVLVIIFVLFCFFRADCIKSAVYDAVMRCLNVIIPSLYAMMIISGFLVRSNIASCGQIFCGLFSMLSGYPVGAKILYSQYITKSISKKDAELLSGIFFGAGGAFIFGCTSYGGELILISNISANIILSIVLLMYFRKNPPEKAQKKKICFSVEMLVESVNSAGRSMAEICFTVMAFSVITAVLREFGIISSIAGILSELCELSPETAENIVCAFLDVTAVSDITQQNYNLIPIISGLISFGGLCVFFQISAIFKGRLSMFPLIISRLIAGISSGIICRILMPIFIKDESIAVSSMSSQLHQSASPVPSIILIIMTVILFYEYEKNFQKPLDKSVFL